MRQERPGPGAGAGPARMIEARRLIEVDGLETGFYEAGEGPVVLLLHSGEHGGCGEITWEANFDALAGEFRVVAPDWLGFGRSAKVHDFVLGAERRLLHLRRFLLHMAIDSAHIVGCSMGGTLALKAMTDEAGFVTARSLTLIGAGGDSPDSAARRDLIDYDCTMDGMRKVVGALFHDPRWAQDENYVARRLGLSLEPGAWECAAAARLKNPLTSERAPGGLVDTTPYERIRCPVLVVAGEQDKIKAPGYAWQLAEKLPDCDVHVLPGCGHMPNIERADAVNAILLGFLRSVEARTPP